MISCILADEPALLRLLDRIVRTNVEWPGIPITIKRLPERMLGIGHEIGHLDHDPARTADVADLGTDPISRGVKRRATNIAEAVDPLLAIALAEDRYHIGAHLLGDGVAGRSQQHCANATYAAVGLADVE